MCWLNDMAKTAKPIARTTNATPSLFRNDYSVYSGAHCPSNLLDAVMRWFLTSFACMISASVVLSNFGLRRPYQTCGRAYVALFLAYVTILIFWFQSDVVYTYRVDLIINLAIDHTIVWVHIVRPIVVEFVQSPSSTTILNPAMHQGIARVLSAYLHSKEGFGLCLAGSGSDTRWPLKATPSTIWVEL
ncbi:hypothetical protein, variant [Aphanomyces astaci]|uniref:Uncharacterized protein n=1 Tax=Aphanomyces astaci TaxID=112090 RepID=W4H3J2_APHAT|nr:hypothetical protein H257_02612 [Aphanomyces astaci]XP_009824628.1 hypothetical protein, variant [Aphanomyces astaci]ETV86155.1 hypothetical protein H257_02612 [Aphanomyces astaci]ETV86156.1 hypothetical protein, variant [Aphanomyces astaci]|eukprot:XP_009824627.1 hypothetical protein H257_02612 [Aphanomyces astaci]